MGEQGRAVGNSRGCEVGEAYRGGFERWVRARADPAECGGGGLCAGEEEGGVCSQMDGQRWPMDGAAGRSREGVGG